MDQGFSHAIVREGFEASGYQCECTEPNCGHDSDEEGRCTQALRWIAQGENAPDGWQPHRIDPDRPPYATNIRILCTNCRRHATAATTSAPTPPSP